MHYLKLIRVKHYIKNMLIFVPLFSAGNFFNEDSLLRVIAGFLSFSLMASVVYIINDLCDAEKDRLHESKCNRPIASGAVPTINAVILAIVLFILSAIINFYLNLPIADYHSWALLLGYIALNVAYSLKLKDIPIFDVAILASGFLIRVMYGSAIAGVRLSDWLYLTILMFSFYMGLGKRRNELITVPEGTTRNVLKHYNYEFLDKNMYICLTLTIIFYSLWTVNAETVERIGTGALIWTVPLIIIICMKYNLIIEKASSGDPVEVLLSNKSLILLTLLFLLFLGSVLYSDTITYWLFL